MNGLKTNSEGISRIFVVNFSYLAAGDLIAKALTFWAFAHIARVLGSDLFGDLGFAAACTLYFRLIVSQGLDVYGIQEVARNRSLVATRGAVILGLRLASSVVAAATLVAAVSLIGKPPHVKGLLLLYGLTLIASAISLQWVFQAAEQMSHVAIANVLGQLVFSVLVLAFLKHPDQLLWIPVLQAAGEVAACGYFLFLFIRIFGRVRASLDWREWRDILKGSVPMGLSSVLSLVMLNFDLILLGFLKPASDVGQYSAAYKIVGFFSSFVLLYNRNLLPAVSRCRGDASMLRRISDRVQKYTLLLSVPLATGGAILSRPLMHLIFGSQFTGGAMALAILLWIIPLASIRALFRATLMSHGLQNWNLYVSLIAVFLNISLNLLWIPRFSYVGSAFASVISELLLLFLSFACVFRKITHLPLLGHVWKPAVASLAMGIFVAGIQSVGLILSILGGILVYTVAGLVLKAFDWSEMKGALGR